MDNSVLTAPSTSRTLKVTSPLRFALRQMPQICLNTSPGWPRRRRTPHEWTQSNAISAVGLSSQCTLVFQVKSRMGGCSLGGYFQITIYSLNDGKIYLKNCGQSCLNTRRKISRKYVQMINIACHASVIFSNSVKGFMLSEPFSLTKKLQRQSLPHQHV